MERRIKRRRLDPKAASNSEDEQEGVLYTPKSLDYSDERFNDDPSLESADEDESSENDSGEEEQSSEESEDDIIQQELAEIDFATLAEAQKSLASSTTRTSSKLQKPSSSKPKPAKLSKPSFGSNSKSKSKNAPQEMSSKMPVSRKHFLHTSTAQSHKPRDPRFDTLNNTVSDQSFRNAYSFLDQYQRDEISMLKQQIRQERDLDERARLEKTLQSLQSRREGRAARDRAAEVLRARKREEREQVAQGKKPYYLKKSEERKLVMEDKYSKLGKKRLEKVLEKKRKKKEGKELRRMPKQRQRNVE